MSVLMCVRMSVSKVYWLRMLIYIIYSIFANQQCPLPLNSLRFIFLHKQTNNHRHSNVSLSVCFAVVYQHGISICIKALQSSVTHRNVPSIFTIRMYSIKSSIELEWFCLEACDRESDRLTLTIDRIFSCVKKYT